MENELQANEVLSQAAAAVTQEAVTVTVDIKPGSRLRALLQRLKIIPAAKRYEIRPLNLGTLVRISRILLSIEVKQSASMLDVSYDAMANHAEKLAEVVALAIHNREAKLPGALVRLVLSNFTAKEIRQVLAVVVSQMDITSFISSIISIRGLNILESPIAAAGDANSDEVSP